MKNKNYVLVTAKLMEALHNASLPPLLNESRTAVLAAGQLLISAFMAATPEELPMVIRRFIRFVQSVTYISDYVLVLRGEKSPESLVLPSKDVD